MSAYLFIRNDDVWTLDHDFRYFFDSAIDRGIPVVHAVIPGKMDRKLVRFLCRAREKTPQLLDIVQHGWIHANHSIQDGRKYEFGPSRTYTAQQEDILLGLKAMRKAFGEHFIPAFVPPYHGYDETTLKVLYEQGFKIFSAGKRRLEVKKSFIKLPAQVPFSRYEEGRKGIHRTVELIADLARGIDQRPLSGVVAHHADFSTPARRKELKIFFDCIAGLIVKEGWRVLLFSDILSLRKL